MLTLPVVSLSNLSTTTALSFTHPTTTLFYFANIFINIYVNIASPRLPKSPSPSDPMVVSTVAGIV